MDEFDNANVVPSTKPGLLDTGKDAWKMLIQTMPNMFIPGMLGFITAYGDKLSPTYIPQSCGNYILYPEPSVIDLFSSKSTETIINMIDELTIIQEVFPRNRNETS